MIIQNKKLSVAILLLAGLFSFQTVQSQVAYTSAAPKMAVEGTSNIHDWVMNSAQGSCKATFTLDGNAITAMSALQFSMQAESLKSEHKAMDKNTYKAINTDKYPAISFVGQQANIKHNGGNSYLVSTKGKLTIGAVSKDVWLAVVCTVNPADKSITGVGSYKFKMSEYGVKPPTIMFGSITVGDQLNVKFNVSLKSN